MNQYLILAVIVLAVGGFYFSQNGFSLDQGTLSFNTNSISGIGTIEVIASNATSIAKMVLQIDGQTYGQPEFSEPYTWSIDSTQYSNGVHILKAISYDSNNQVIEERTQAVTFSNTGTPSSKYVMMNLVTWRTDNGYSSLDWNAITDLSVFHVTPQPDGTIRYDGNAVNVGQVIADAHSRGKRVCLAIGGAGLDFTATNNMLQSATARAKVQDSLVNEVVGKGYDCIELDFEDNYNKAGMTAMSKETCQKMHARGKQCNQAVADWFMGSLDIPAIDSSVDHYHYMFDPSITKINALSSKVSNKCKIAIGFELSKETVSGIQSKLDYARDNCYGLMFWNARDAPQFYDAIKLAG